MKSLITDILVFMGILGTTVAVWQMLELGIEGEIVANYVDSFIAIILAFSLFGNYKKLEDDEKTEVEHE